MTAQEELLTILDWAVPHAAFNIAAVLRRVLASWKLKRNSFMPRGGFDQGRIKHTNFEEETPGDTAWRLILSDNPTETARVEAAYGRTQAQTVDDLLSIVAEVRLSRAMWAARAQLGNGFPLCAPIGTRLIERFIEGNM
jgi:hypothetical protein